MLLWTVPALAAPEPTARSVAFGATGDDPVVEVPLLRGSGDPRPRVEARVDEGLPVLAYVDLLGGTTRVGMSLAIRQGLEVTGPYEHRTTVLPWVRVGDVVITELSARVEPGEDLVLGLAGLPGTASALVASRGVARFAPSGTVFDVEGETLAVDADGRFETTVGATVTAVGLRTDRAESMADASLPGREILVGGRPVLDLPIALGVTASSVRWVRDESADAPVLGADVAVFHDLASDPEKGTLVVGPALRPLWQDAGERSLEILERRHEGLAVPEPRAAAQGDDPGDLLGRLGFAELARARWAGGDLAGALAADRSLALSAGDRCDLHLEIGIRAVRAADPTAIDALGRAASIWTRWSATTPEARSDARSGETPKGSDTLLEQPDACAAAAAWVALAGGPVGALDGPGGAWVRAREALIAQRPATGPLRAALDRTTRLDPPLRAALAIDHAREGRAAAAVDAASVLPDLADPHPLTTALALALGAGPALWSDVLTERPDWIAGRLVGLALDSFDLQRPNDADLDLGASLERAQVARSGDPSVRCQGALFDGLRAPAVVPALAEPDCLVAAFLLARLRGDPDQAAASGAALLARWPDVWPLDDPSPLAVRRLRVQEEP